MLPTSPSNLWTRNFLSAAHQQKRSSTFRISSTRIKPGTFAKLHTAARTTSSARKYISTFRLTFTCASLVHGLHRHLQHIRAHYCSMYDTHTRTHTRINIYINNIYIYIYTHTKYILIYIKIFIYKYIFIYKWLHIVCLHVCVLACTYPDDATACWITGTRTLPTPATPKMMQGLGLIASQTQSLKAATKRKTTHS